MIPQSVQLVCAISFREFIAAAVSCEVTKELIDLITSGWPKNVQSCPPRAKPYFPDRINLP